MNELEALEVCHALVEAEQDYYKSAHAYTTKFVSAAGKHDGLYWTGWRRQEPGSGRISAHAGMDSSAGSPTSVSRLLLPNLRSGGRARRCRGVSRRIPLLRESSPLSWTKRADAYEKDLGDPQTADAAKQISSTNPDKTWIKSE